MQTIYVSDASDNSFVPAPEGVTKAQIMELKPLPPPGIKVLVAKLTVTGQKLDAVVRFEGALPASGARAQLHVLDAAGQLSINADFALTEPSTVAGSVTSYARSIDMAGKAGKWLLASTVFVDEAPWPEVPGVTNGEGVVTQYGHRVVGNFELAGTIDPGGYGTLDRPFVAGSPWNARLPASVRLVTDVRVADWRNKGVADLFCNVDRFTPMVYRASSADPLETVNVRVHDIRGKAVFRMPRSAASDGTTDSTLLVLIPAGEQITVTPDGKAPMVFAGPAVAEMWQAAGGPGQRTCSSFAPGDVDQDEGWSWSGPGIPGYYKPGCLGWGGVSAYGGSGLVGLLRAGDLTKEQEPYAAVALAARYDVLGHPANNAFLVPATKDDGTTGVGGKYSGRVIMGTRFAIPRSFTIPAFWPLAARLLTKRLQEFGGIVTDQSEGAQFRCDGVSAQADARALNAIPVDVRRAIKAQMLAVAV